ncbi:acylphosphatase-2 isoform X1 [Mus pahari]|uniref:acylphosphatase-2 isoform X1 n=1 Tax=Mus pahari TaxID=10093 RepID=UPI0011148965|nr:acylphosphatase-2 isoform X1 [Mus pahari]
MTELLKSVDYEVFGAVQGVCFRMYTEGEAKKRGLVGWVKNTSKGTVTGQVQGPEEKVDAITALGLLLIPDELASSNLSDRSSQARTLVNIQRLHNRC